jgi:hypothetical protein
MDHVEIHTFWLAWLIRDSEFGWRAFLFIFTAPIFDWIGVGIQHSFGSYGQVLAFALLARLLTIGLTYLPFS